MKKVISLLCLVAASTVASAEGDMFNQFKAMHVSGIQQRMSILQTDLNCVQAAQQHEDMKKCEETARQAMENFRQSQEQKMQSLKQTAEQMHQQHGAQQGNMNNGQGPAPQARGGMNQQLPGQGTAPQVSGQQ